jgi:hypothetical protein
MKPILGFLLLFVLSPVVLLVLLSPLPEDWIAFPLILSFASWLLRTGSDR